MNQIWNYLLIKLWNLELIKNVSKRFMLKICVRRSGSLGEIISALQIRFKITGWKIHFWANDFLSHVWKFYKLEKLNHWKCSSKAKVRAHQSRTQISKEGTSDYYFRTGIFMKEILHFFLLRAIRIHKN